jgi:hypothetical protein
VGSVGGCHPSFFRIFRASQYGTSTTAPEERGPPCANLLPSGLPSRRQEIAILQSVASSALSPSPLRTNHYYHIHKIKPNTQQGYFFRLKLIFLGDLRAKRNLQRNELVTMGMLTVTGRTQFLWLESQWRRCGFATSRPLRQAYRPTLHDMANLVPTHRLDLVTTPGADRYHTRGVVVVEIVKNRRRTILGMSKCIKL